MLLYCYVVVSMLYIGTPPSSPPNLHITTATNSISWEAPLDTPLCVQSYTVTVRNSCYSSQVMVYNTTDNRSSLSIIDLIMTDGEYSVTVVGKDRAGRLGQKSNKMQFIRKLVLY